MKRYFLPLLLLLPPLAAYCQPTPLKISLAQQHMAAAAGPYHFERLVDARPDRSTIGSVHRGMENQLVPATFSGSFEEELTPLLQQGLPAGAGSRPVVVRVHTLAVHESIGSLAETASAELEADFLEPVGPDQYRLLLSVAELAESRGLDATGKHADNLRRVVEQGLQRLREAPAPAATTGTAGTEAAALLTWAQVQAGEEGTPARFPVQTQPLVRGVYRSFEEFRQNTPTLTEGPFELKRKPRKGAEWAGTDKTEAWYLELGPNQPRRLVRQGWGLSDGTNAYIFHRGHLQLLQPAGNHYTFLGLAPPDAGAMVVGGMMGGALGGALAGAASAGQPQPYELRMASGRVVASLQSAGTGGFATQDTAAVYLYRRADASPATPLTVLVDGKAVGTLGPDQYLLLVWRDRRRDMRICLQDAAQTCYTFVPLFGGSATYLAYGQPTPGGPPTLQPVAAREGAFQIRHLKLRQKK